jgi:trimeric autotransporter adhesin
MSTKTTFKRVALVAVASLGFGMISVVPSSALANTAAQVTALLEEATVKVTAMKVTNAVVRKGTAAATDVSVSMLVGAADLKNTFKAVLVAVPATSALNNSSITLAAPSATPLVSTTGNTIVGTFVAGTAGGAAAEIAVGGNTAADTITAATNLSKKAISASITPDVAGIYKVLIWNDQNADGLVTTGEKSATYQVTAGGIPTVMTLNTVNASAPTYTAANPLVGNNYGSLTTLSLKDAEGNLTKLATGEGIALAPSTTTATIDVNAGGLSVAGATVNLTSATAVNSTGLVAINVRDTAAGATTLTATPTGVTISTIPAQVVNITYKTMTEFPASGVVTISTLKTCSVVSGVAAVIGSSTATNCSSLGGTVTMKYTQTTTLATQYLAYTIKDTAGVNTGIGGANYSGYVSPSVGVATVSFKYSTTAAVTDKTPAVTTIGAFVSSTDLLSNGFTVTPVDPSFATGTMNVSNVSAVTGGKISLIATAVDQFGAAVVGQVAAFSISGRNVTTTATNVLTDALGQATYSYTDAGTTGADTVSFTVGGATGASTSVSYAATNAVSKVALSTDDYVAGVANDSVAAQPIVASTSTTGKAGAEAGAKSFTAKVTNAAGIALVGVPVTFTVSGTTAAIVSTSVTTYTSALGVATSSVYAWKSGTYTITATSGAVSGTATETFAQSNADSARTITAAVNGAVVTATAKDRFGNPVGNVRVYAKISAGSGFFGTGVLSTYADTATDGTVSFVVAGGSATVVVSNISFSSPAGTIVGQTSAAAGSDVGGSGAVVFVATVAGTASLAAAGVGNDQSAAGVSSATVEVSLTNAAETAADAAAEATDAANAATDAANAAAEAADAATAAAQDAADAVAALSTQVSEMVNALKKQITALTNLVIKIQKKVKA